jgi:hypothetical protein
MTIFHVTDQGGRLLGVVRAADGDESAAREMMAGKGAARDERFVGHDGGMVVSAVDPEAAPKVLWRDESAPKAKVDEAPVAGGKPDNRGSK